MKKNRELIPYIFLNSRKLVAFLLFIFFSGSSFSQNIKLIGSLYNSENKNPIPYANLSIYNMPIGTCTNIYGDFVINLPDSLAENSLEISCIGYKSLSIPIDSLINIDTLTIFMQAHTYNIKDIVIIPGKNDAHSIFKKAISRINNNYPKKKYYLEAFFRHSVFNVKKQDKTTRLTEAAISIHKNHYSVDNNKIQIQKIRNSNNYVALSKSIGKKMLYKVLGGNENPIYRTLRLEAKVQKEWMRKLLKNKHFEISSHEVSFYENSLIHVIEFKQKSWEFMLKTFKTTHTFRKYKYYIDTKDYAILKLVSRDISYNPEYTRSHKNDSVLGEATLSFTKFNEKYYLKHATYYGMVPDRVDVIDENNFNEDETELLVNHIAARRKDYNRIKYRNQLKKEKIIWDMEYEYEPEFWENYNILLDNPLGTKAKNDLEHEVQLEQQFKSTGNVNKKN